MSRIPKDRPGYTGYACTGMAHAPLDPVDCLVNKYGLLFALIAGGQTNAAYEDLSALDTDAVLLAIHASCGLGFNPFTGTVVDFYQRMAANALDHYISADCYPSADSRYEAGFTRPRPMLNILEACGCGGGPEGAGPESSSSHSSSSSTSPPSGPLCSFTWQATWACATQQFVGGVTLYSAACYDPCTPQDWSSPSYDGSYCYYYKTTCEQVCQTGVTDCYALAPTPPTGLPSPSSCPCYVPPPPTPGYYCVAIEIFSNMTCSGLPLWSDVICALVTSDGNIHGGPASAQLGVCTAAGAGMWFKYTTLTSYHGTDPTCGGGGVCGTYSVPGYYCVYAQGWANCSAYGVCDGTYTFYYNTCVYVDSAGKIAGAALGDCLPGPPAITPTAMMYLFFLSYHGTDPTCGGGC